MATTRTIIFDFKTKGVNIADQMRDAETAAAKAQTSIGKNLDAISTKANDIGKKMQGVGIGLTAGLTLPLVGAAKSGVEYNAQMEQYATSFGTMLGDDVKAAEYMLKLKEMAAKTPFEMTDLADSAKTLMAFGRTADQTTGDMQMLGDISQGNAEKFGSLTNAFGKMASSGKMTGEELNMMIDAGFNPLTSMSEKSGKSMEELRAEMEKGNISFEDVQASMESATSKGGLFYGSMEAQSKTLNGQLSTLKDTFMTALGEAVLPLSNYIRDVLIPKITTLIEKFQALSPGVKKAIGVFALIAIAIGPALFIIGTLMRTLGTVFKFIKILGTAFKILRIIMMSSFGPVVLAIIAVIAIIILVIKYWDEIKAVAIRVGEAIGAFFSGMWDKIKSIFTSIGDFIGNTMLAIKTSIHEKIEAIKGAFQTIKDVVVKVFNAAKDIISNIFETIGNIIKIPINAIIDGINVILKGINKIKIPSWVPGIGGKSPNFSMIPTLAKGGIVNSATQAIIGEAGPEAVVPLNEKSIANFTAGIGIGGGQNININIPQQKMALVDLNGNMIGNIILPQITRKLKIGGALT